MQTMPSMDQLTGQQQQQAPQASPKDMQMAQAMQKPEVQTGVIVQKIVKMLQDTGYFDLPENKNRRGEINQEIFDIAESIMEGNAEMVQQSEIFQYITAQKGQISAMRNPAEQMQMPDMEGMAQ